MLWLGELCTGNNNANNDEANNHEKQQSMNVHILFGNLPKDPKTCTKSDKTTA